MDEFSSRYDNLYPLQPEYIDYDSAQNMNPTIKKQHMAPFDDKRTSGYYSAPPYQVSHDEYTPYPMRYPRINTFSVENSIYHMKKRIDIIYWLNIIIIVLVVMVVAIVTVMAIFTSAVGKRL